MLLRSVAMGRNFGRAEEKEGWNWFVEGLKVAGKLFDCASQESETLPVRGDAAAFIEMGEEVEEDVRDQPMLHRPPIALFNPNILPHHSRSACHHDVLPPFLHPFRHLQNCRIEYSAFLFLLCLVAVARVG